MVVPSDHRRLWWLQPDQVDQVPAVSDLRTPVTLYRLTRVGETSWRLRKPYVSGHNARKSKNLRREMPETKSLERQRFRDSPCVFSSMGDRLFYFILFLFFT